MAVVGVYVWAGCTGINPSCAVSCSAALCTCAVLLLLLLSGGALCINCRHLYEETALAQSEAKLAKVRDEIVIRTL